MGCTSLSHITLPVNLTELNYGSFRNCSALEEINLSNLSILGSACFSGCNSLNIDVNIPNAKEK